MKNKLLKHLSFLFFVIITTSCSNNYNDDSQILDSLNNSVAFPTNSQTILRINSELFNTLNTNRLNKESSGESYIINKVNREKDSIQINLSYSGGCNEHVFEVIWDGIVYTDEPCHMNLLIVHNGNNDDCEALVTETIYVNLNELIGDIVYKDSCAYHIYSTFNSNDSANVVVEGIN